MAIRLAHANLSILAFLYSCHTARKIGNHTAAASILEETIVDAGDFDMSAIPAIAGLPIWASPHQMDEMVAKSIRLSHLAEPFFNKDIATKQDRSAFKVKKLVFILDDLCGNSSFESWV